MQKGKGETIPIYSHLNSYLSKSFTISLGGSCKRDICGEQEAERYAIRLKVVYDLVTEDSKFEEFGVVATHVLICWIN